MGDCAVIVPNMFLKVIPPPAGVPVIPLSEPRVGYSVCLIVNRGRAVTQLGQTITAIGQSIRPGLEGIAES